MNLIVQVPWSTPPVRLGVAYNEAMERVPRGDAGVLLDHDAMFTIRGWYPLIQSALTRHENIGVLGAVTNRIGNATQRTGGLTTTHDISQHRTRGERLALEHGTDVIDITRTNGDLLGGVVMVVPRSVWDVVKFDESLGMYGVDNQFHRDLRDAGYRVLIMRGLYVYHWYRGDHPDIKEAQVAR